jgi:hypothetical protein
MPKVSLTYENGVQKGPAPDYSMLLEMKKRAILVADATNHGTNGRKNTGITVDSKAGRGFTDGPVTAVWAAKGAKLGFLKF